MPDEATNAPDDAGARVENPPAFPSVRLNDPCHEASVPGMSLRDWFAGQAVVLNFGPKLSAEEVAGHAYKVADAMLAARAAS